MFITKGRTIKIASRTKPLNEREGYALVPIKSYWTEELKNFQAKFDFLERDRRRREDREGGGEQDDDRRELHDYRRPESLWICTCKLLLSTRSQLL